MTKYIPEWKLEDLRSTLRAKNTENKTALAEWQKVTRNRKKDGSDFVNLAKNFNNAHIDAMSSTTWLQVYYQCNGWKEDSILIADLSVDDIFTRINMHIDDLQRNIEGNENNLMYFDTLVNTCLEKIESALDALIDNSHGKDLSEAVCELISKEYLYYSYRH